MSRRSPLQQHSHCLMMMMMPSIKLDAIFELHDFVFSNGFMLCRLGFLCVEGQYL
jgi:hypothetical protein